MSAKLVSLFITFLINAAVAVIILFGMLVAMNGFSESDATWGLGTYVLLALTAAITLSIGAFFTTGLLIRKQFRPITASLIAILVFSIVGFGLEIVCSLIGIGVAEIFRTKS